MVCLTSRNWCTIADVSGGGFQQDPCQCIKTHRLEISGVKGLDTGSWDGTRYLGNINTLLDNINILHLTYYIYLF